ncbi:Collagen alpha-1(XII) chain [Chionoecetes opilio]|uniref:Collagen alpha-1(XII) chain n=1 Tax=Chionoecetes opilio TaxID=41210 RepID=A0A8J5CNK7_CHIOP|nr:Collagen alpha-1(XII) chain [Chionoecetes opilio]
MSSFYKGFLLLAVLLGSAATLDEDEGQEKWEAVSLVATRFGKDTADGVPEMPKNFRVSPESSSLVMATWDRPASGADVDHYIVSEDSNGKQDTTSSFYYLWEDLEACTKYAFSLRAVTSTGDTSEPAQGEAQTLVGIPPEPRDLHVEKYTYDTVTLAWEHPDTQCDIDHYRVRYSGGESAPLDALVSETTLTVTDLLPDTAYTFSVYASTLEGEGPAATVENTPDTVGPPEDLVAEGISSSAINVSWSAPFAEPLHYEVSAPPCMWGTEDVNHLMYVIEDLKPCQRCFITVTSIYSDGREFSASISEETDFDAPPPPKNCHVEVQKELLAASWERPIAECALGIYNVVWTSKKLWGNLEEESDSINTTGLSHTVYNPPPYHEYTFHIAASIKGIFGSPTACSNTSLESPAGPPVNVSTASQEHGEVRVTWESPEEENGEILKYGIFTNDATNSSKEVSGDVHSAAINVEPCHTVGIWVAALNHAGWGEQSNVTNVTVVGDVLPEELHCHKPEPEVQVCWKPYSRDCPGTQYNLKWEGDVLWSDTLTDMNDTTLAWSEEEICYIIPSTPYTTYTVDLSVGKKPDATITCVSTTPMAAPGPPSLEELQTDGLAINVAWKEPVEKNGVISAYQVKWVDWKGEHTYNTPDANTFSHQIMEPWCGGEVAVTVRANTTEVEEFGEESEPRIVFFGILVRNLTCEATEPGVVELTWEVTDSQCPVDSFNVTWTFASLWSEDKGSSWTTIDEKENSTVLTSLPPYARVSVEVYFNEHQENGRCTSITPEESGERGGAGDGEAVLEAVQTYVP